MELKEWQDENKPLNNIINSDCIDFLKSVESNSIDLIVSSPPYNVGIDYDKWKDDMEWEDYLKWCKKWLIECYRILKDDGRICINHYINFHLKGGRSKFPLMDFRNIQEQIGFDVYKLVLWEDRTCAKLHAFGSWLSASAPHINTPYEGILISYKNQWKKINKGESTISRDEFLEAVFGVWKLKPATQQLTKACFPVELPERCINLLTYKDDVVLDMFMGSGSTAIAALKTGRKFLGSELSKDYCDTANKRINEHLMGIKNMNNYKCFF